MYTVQHFLSKGDGRVTLSWPHLRQLYKGRKCSLWLISEEISSLHCQDQLDELIHASIMGCWTISLTRDGNVVLGTLQRKSIDCTDSNISLIYCCKHIAQRRYSHCTDSIICITLKRDLTLFCYYMDQYDFTQIYLYRMPVSC